MPSNHDRQGLEHRSPAPPEAARPLLRHTGRWTHRDRQRHHPFPIQVPERTAEIRIRFRWGPIQVGSRHERNLLTLSLLGPKGFRGAAVRERGDQTITIGTRTTSAGFLAGPIDPGGWLLVVDAAEILNDGAESGWLEFAIDVDAVPAERDEDVVSPPVARSTPRRGRPPQSGPRWFRGDLHSHTTHSDGRITVADRARGAAARGMDFLAITDHNTISQSRAADPWPEDLTRIGGCEITTFHGHLAVLGIHDWIDWRDASRGGGASAILDQARRQNAVVSINHPSAFGNPWCAGCHWDFARVDYARIQAIEVWNGRWSEPETDNSGALALWTDLLDAGLRPTAISGTDSHSAEEDDYPAQPLTYVYADDGSEASILDGIRRGTVILSSGPSLRFRAHSSDGVDVVIPGAEHAGEFDLAVDVEGIHVPATLWYVTSGSMSALGMCPPPGARFTQRVTAARWWRLELRAGEAATGDLLGLTNPVYVGRRQTVATHEGPRQ